jgi:hypothetical protein
VARETAVTSTFHAASYLGAVVPTLIAGALTTITSLLAAALNAIFMLLLASALALLIRQTAVLAVPGSQPASRQPSKARAPDGRRSISPSAKLRQL